jgi:hypothetical protein
MPSPVMSFEEFMDQIRVDVPERIRQDNERIEDNIPDLLELKASNRQRSLLLHPGEAKDELKGLIERSERADKFLDIVSAVRDESVEITGVQPGHRSDRRDYILKGRNLKTREDVMDYRVLIGRPERQGDDIRNEVTQGAFYKAVGLHAIPEKAFIPDIKAIEESSDILDHIPVHEGAKRRLA